MQTFSSPCMTKNFDIEKDIQNLHRRHGSGDLERILLKLVTAMDRAKSEEEKEHAHLILKRLCHVNHDIDATPSAWLSFLEDMPVHHKNWKRALRPPNRLTLEDIMRENAEKERNNLYSAEQYEKAQRANRSWFQRLFSNSDDDLDNLSPNQQVWAKAIRREKSKNLRRVFRIILFLTGLSLVIGAGFYLKRFRFEDTPPPPQHFSPQPQDRPTQEPFSPGPGIIWATFSAGPKAINTPFIQTDPDAILDSADRATLPGDLKMKLKAELPNDEQARLLLDVSLFKLESSIQVNPVRPMAPFDVNKVPEGKMQWVWTRYSPTGEELASGMFVQSVSRKGRELHVTLQRSWKENGMAHRITLDSSGLVSWSFRCRYDGIVRDGNLRREAGMNYVCKYHENGEWVWKFEQKAKRGDVVLPATWAPIFAKSTNSSVILPFARQFCASVSFFLRHGPVHDMSQFVLHGEADSWKEEWTLLPSGR